jgi:protein TonB
MGLLVHLLALAAITLMAVYAPDEEMPPHVTALAFAFAPPPPSPQRLGSSDGDQAAARSNLPSEPRPTGTLVPRHATTPPIPAEFLETYFEVALGVEDGLVDGELGGMRGGVPGGVVGGVPGGLVGGKIGGAGRAVMEFPTPEVAPRPIRMPQPSYTRKAIRDNVSGTVVLRVVIDEQGKVKVLEVLRSIPDLDEEAIRVVESQWRFHPAMRQGRPVPALSDLRVRFHLY